MVGFNWVCPNKKHKIIDIRVEGTVTKRMIKKLKNDHPGRKIRINGESIKKFL